MDMNMKSRLARVRLRDGMARSHGRLGLRKTPLLQICAISLWQLMAAETSPLCKVPWIGYQTHCLLKPAGKTVFVKNGDYEELVYFRNKRFVTIQGESMDGVVVHYPNNEVFNPHPVDIKTNEQKGTFPSRRAAVAADNCADMIFKDITFKTDCKGQAEGFLLNGERNFAENVHVIGDGDALQVNGFCLLAQLRD